MLNTPLANFLAEGQTREQTTAFNAICHESWKLSPKKSIARQAPKPLHADYHASSFAGLDSPGRGLAALRPREPALPI
jgi:hypothetical protein